MPDKIKLRVGHLKITDHLILGITRKKLELTAETFNKCEIEAVPMTGWNQIGEKLINGEIDVAFMLAPYAMELFHSGIDIRLVLFSHRSGSTIVTNKKAGIEKIEDFKGKTILIPYHLSFHHIVIDKICKEKGLEVGAGKDVVFETVAPSQIKEFLGYDENGDIGGFIVAEPYGSQVVKEGIGKELALSKDIWPDHPCCVVIVRNEILEKHEEALEELTTSFVKSGFFVGKNSEKAAAIGAEFLDQSYDVMKRVLCDPPDRLTTERLMPTPDELEKMQTYLTGEISAMSGKIDLEKFIDTRFADSAGAK